MDFLISRGSPGVDSALGSDREEDHATFRSDFRWDCFAPVDAALFLDPDLQSVRVS